MIIYLAGGIHGLTFDEANDWRDDADYTLRRAGHEVLSPMRGRLWKGADEQSQFSPNEIVHRDLIDIAMANVLLVEYECGDRAYTGTTCEMWEAYRTGKAIVVMVGDREAWSPWLDYIATKVVRSWDEAYDFIINVLGG
jgi:hypothetical protein